MNSIKKNVSIGIFTLGILSFIACKEKVAHFDAAQYQKIAEDGNVQLRDAVLRKNADSVIQVYASNAILCPPSEDFIKGKEAIRNWWQGSFDYGLLDLETKIVQITGSSERFYELGRIIVTMESSPGDTSYIETDKYLVVWAKQPNGDYKIEAEMWNLDREHQDLLSDTSSVQ